MRSHNPRLADALEKKGDLRFSDFRAVFCGVDVRHIADTDRR